MSATPGPTEAGAPRVALVTAEVAHAFDVDLGPLLDALAAHGAQAVAADWHDDAVDWSAFDLVLVRSPWDYHARLDEFLAWADRAAAVSDLHNPLDVLRWNTDKRYLDDLAAHEVPTVPTRWCAPGEAEGFAWPDGGEVVVKPTVSAGSRNTARFDLDDPAERAAAVEHLTRIGAMGKTAMVQPYVASVDDRGETAVIVIDGTISHGVRKGPMLAPGGEVASGLFAAEELQPRTPTADETDAAHRAVAAVEARFATVPLYARVDLIAGADGAPVVLELELTEPALFLVLAPDPAQAADAYARAALARHTRR